MLPLLLCDNHQIQNVAQHCGLGPTLLAQERNALRKIRERGAWLGCSGHGVPGSYRLAMRRRTGAEMWALAAPYVTCPWDFTKEPSAAVRHNGGKWICGLSEIGARRDCVVYSFGSNSAFDFEMRVRAASACEIHIFDPTSPPPNAAIHQRLNRSARFAGGTFFHSVGLGASNAIVTLSQHKGRFPVQTLQTLMRQLGHAETGIDLLKYANNERHDRCDL